MHKRFYESSKLKNWMCELCTFSQIRSHFMIIATSETNNVLEPKIDTIKYSNEAVTYILLTLIEQPTITVTM